MVKLCDNRQGGFSLIEVVIALALLGVVLAIGYNYFNFGFRSYQTGERQAIAQTGVRTGIDFAVKELRYADTVELSNSIPAGLDDFYYIYQENNSVIYQSPDQKKILLDSNQDQIVYSFLLSEVKFDITSNITLVISTLIAAEDIYSLGANVQVLNLTNLNDYSDTTASGQKATVVKYTKP